ncbi:DUF4393 domain-containing protein [Planococcus sp. ANT_H30]|uniref:DUF4393 domain-containing protein n=1 Tax=Planococcus sp. ANT_H30 TaxID=2597347 RepID=UPI0011EC30D9|nr:DUF4393 domain-containing protein [Planococcus sp. ANT_H30]KAA0958274.1 DUF4393 domain-containing protein [Planococcus sp. ANT_H30]
MSNIKDTAEAIKGIAEAVPVYEDMLQPATQELSKGFVVVAKTVNMALAPLSALVWGYDKISNYLDSSIAKKLEGVPEENIISPDPSVAGPAIEALRFSGENENIREMFSELLATAMNRETAVQAHPSFVEIIKQLSTDEAKIISNIKHNGLFPLISIRSLLQDGSNGFNDLKKNFTSLPYNLGCLYPEMTSSYIENLDRLGLISIDTGTHIQEEFFYSDSINHPVAVNLVSTVQDPSRKADIQKYSFSRTEFGEKFVNACTTS